MIGGVTLVCDHRIREESALCGSCQDCLAIVGVSPSRNCDLGPRDTAANRDAVIGGSPSLCRIRENLKEEVY
jgi:hypothetical protein